MSTINLVAHGLTAGQRVIFSDIVGGVPIDVDAVYYIITAGLTADAFQISEIAEGTALTFTTMTSGNVAVVPETEESDTGVTTYAPITDATHVMAPPTMPVLQAAPVMSSSINGSIVRLKVVPA